MSAHDLAMTMIREVLYTTGITAKHAASDKDGVRIAELDEESFRYLLWDHKPLTDFWQTGPGTVRRLEKHGIHTMGELARASIHFPEINSYMTKEVQTLRTTIFAMSATTALRRNCCLTVAQTAEKWTIRTDLPFTWQPKKKYRIFCGLGMWNGNKPTDRLLWYPRGQFYFCHKLYSRTRITSSSSP